MKYKIGNGIEAEGTPAEIAEFLQPRHYKGNTDVLSTSETQLIPAVVAPTAPVAVENMFKAKPAKRVYKLSEAQRKKNREYQRLWLARKKAKTVAKIVDSIPTQPESIIPGV